ncbi:phage head closure protein [Virgibacillus halodenitrificans]|uniref:phage head closure protein n=1 Tax=Virgibacillus halodenitrificans TaxID=1482 RepID=UPI001FB31456|nr:phage head closure protein [Virgibacillus halodenitrificans]MCJ0932925.1 phage head closure protein [Virgibacillus halodenitrificans]
MNEEFPHQVIFQVYTEPQSDGGGGYLPGTGGWFNLDQEDFYGFLDTPKSGEIYQAQQLQHPFDRYLFYPYRTDIKTDMRVTCEGDTYELVGKPLDQGGQHEIMKVSLRLVANG